MKSLYHQIKPKTMKTISFVNTKGGTGKTTLSISLSLMLKNLGAKVLCIDMDTQNNSLSFYFSQAQNIKSGKSIYNAFKEEDILSQVDHCSTHSIDYINTDERVFDLKKYPVHQLKNMLQRCNKEYDFCIIDSSPTYDETTISTYIASDIILIPTSVDPFAGKSLHYLIDKLEDLDLDASIGIIINNFNPSKSKREDAFKKILLDLIQDERLKKYTLDTRYPVMETLKKLITYQNYKMQGRVNIITKELIKEIFEIY